MSNVPNDAIVQAAITALAPFYPTDAEQVQNMLLFWVRRAEMTDVDLAEIVKRMFPLDEKLIAPPACPAWCTGEHLSEESSAEFRDCTSEEFFLPARINGATEAGLIQVDVVRTFNRMTGALLLPTVQLEDYDLTPKYARLLARALVRAADLVDGCLTETAAENGPSVSPMGDVQ